MFKQCLLHVPAAAAAPADPSEVIAGVFLAALAFTFLAWVLGVLVEDFPALEDALLRVLTLPRRAVVALRGSFESVRERVAFRIWLWKDDKECLAGRVESVARQVLIEAQLEADRERWADSTRYSGAYPTWTGAALEVDMFLSGTGTLATDWV